MNGTSLERNARMGGSTNSIVQNALEARGAVAANDSLGPRGQGKKQAQSEFVKILRDNDRNVKAIKERQERCKKDIEALTEKVYRQLDRIKEDITQQYPKEKLQIAREWSEARAVFWIQLH